MTDPAPPPPIDRQLDARGLKCPLPVLLARKALREMHGGVLELLATDRGVEADVMDLCEVTGAVVLGFARDGETRRFWLRAPR